MIAAWMVYTVVVSLLLALAAWAAERVLRILGRPVRFAWALQIAAAVGVPVWSILPRSADGSGVAVDPTPIFLEPLEVSVGEASMMHLLDRPLLAAWCMLSALLLIRAAFVGIRMLRMSERWAPEELDGARVLVSKNVGPAVAGVLRPTIVLPRWIYVNRGGLDLVVAHESEHLRARDAQLLAGAATLTALVPWNPVLWWSLRRLRLAAELDCDARVLARFPERLREYCELLLTVGLRRGPALPVPALSEPPTLLERRIDIMTRHPQPRSRARMVLLTALVSLAVGLACFYPDPDQAASDPLAVAAEAIDLRSNLADGPTFTPFTAAPQLRNTPEVRDALDGEYPPLLRDAGIGGTINVWFFIGPSGQVIETRIQKSSGHPALDSAALRVAAKMRFGPAMNDGEPVHVWVAFPITFTVN